MNLDGFHFLLSSEGERWLQNTAVTQITPENHLQVAAQLRKQLPSHQANAVIETVVLRQQAVMKFSRASHMFFTRPALQQASSEPVSEHRAKRFVAAGYDHIVDLGCSIGGDALTLATHGRVTGVDWDPLRLTMAQENVRAYENGERFSPLQADLLALTPFAADAAFFDPARRDERGRRFYSVHQYQPPLNVIEPWRAGVRGTAVKISPGVDYAELPTAAEAEFVSLNGDVKECVLWFDDLHSGVTRRATLLPMGVTLTDKDMPAEAVPVTVPKSYLYEPDGAVIRAHLVQAVAHQLGAAKIDEHIAYLTADTSQETPFARCYEVEAYFPFQLKQLRHYLHKRQIGQVTIKKRGSPIDPDRLQQKLRLRGSKNNQCTIFLTHIQGEPAVIVGQAGK